MAKHDNKIAEQFQNNLKDLDTMSEQDLLDRLNETIKAVENDDSYNTNEKLKIYAFISSISNVDAKERKKFVTKTYKALR
jgi:hypothetical protein